MRNAVLRMKPFVRPGQKGVATAKPWMEAMLCKAALAVLMILASALAMATDVTVRNVKAQQRYPWNGLVDIDYEVVCEDDSMDFLLTVIGENRDTGRTFPLRTLTGDGAGGTKVKAGTHRMTWDMTKDAPSLVTTNFVVNIQAYHGLPLYMVIDTSKGWDSNLGFPVTYLREVPEGGWSDEYKKTKIVLRRIDPGSFMMGSPETELGHRDDETLHPVTITKPFYIGVFEITCWQWAQLMATGVPNGSSEQAHGNNNLDSVGTRPQCATYDEIRGKDKGSAWPGSSDVDDNSFMWRIRKATNNPLIDLPTEAQWEYACRAGTDTGLNNGNDLTKLENCPIISLLATCQGNRSGGYYSYGYGNYVYYGTVVGSWLENAWGLYDMHGNIAEWCLDWYGAYDLSSVQVDPRGAVLNAEGRRITRGGHIDNRAAECRSAARASSAVNDYAYNVRDHYVIHNGFRFVVNVE